MRREAGAGVEEPQAGLPVEDIVERARSLRPLLREQQAEVEQRTYHSAEMHQRFTEAGFYRMVQPRRYGGAELPLDVFYRVIVEIARGCPSTGWCLCLASGHALNVGSLFPAAAQEALFGPDGHFVCASRGAPLGTAERTEGGWVINGRWDYCSGVPYSTHVQLSVRLPAAADGTTPLGTAVIPRDRWTMLEDWGELLGMRGSGSHSVVVEGAEIPEEWVVPVYLGSVGVEDTQGLAVTGNPMYAAPVLTFLTGELTAVAVGTVRAALDEHAEILTTKRTMMPPHGPRSEDPELQLAFGTALGLVDGAEGMLMRAASLYHALAQRGAEGGEPFGLDEDLRLAAMLARANEMCVDAMDMIMRNAGSSAARNGSRMQRYWRDMTTFRTHPTNTWEGFAKRNAAAYLGVTVASPMADAG